MTIVFSPILPSWILAGLAAFMLAGGLYGGARRARGLILRALAALCLIVWMAGPRLVHPLLRPVPQEALLVVDHSPSMTISDRAALVENAARQLTQEASRLPGLTLHRLDVSGGLGRGTRLFEAMNRALLAQGRFAGAILLTDGMNHDTPATLPAWFHHADGHAVPLHLLLAGKGEEVDRRLRVLSTPPYVILGQEAAIRVQVDDLGAPPGARATLRLQTGEGRPVTREILTGQPQEITVPIRTPGETLIGLSVSALQGESSLENNTAVLRIHGVRDRLRVLLISGAPNQGERVWRRLLKADPSVDLVHFTILRSPETEDDTPLSDLALIPFPTHELFEEKIKSFDLIILDGFRNEHILPPSYLSNIAAYVRQGGGLLVVAGPEFVQEGSLQNTALGEIFPAHIAPDGVIARPLHPQLTPLGHTHPVTEGLNPGWGPWYRALKADRFRGENLLTAADGTPLLLLDRVEQGRVAMLLSDQIWLWSRGEQGGGPQAELLRRLSHWLMKEPELEENRLSASIDNGQLTVERHAGGPAKLSPEAIVTAPDGRKDTLRLTREGGLWRGTAPAAQAGIWTVRQDGLTAFASPARRDPVEDQDLRATAGILGKTAETSGGGVYWLGRGLPHLKQAEAGSSLHGDGWLALPVSRAAVPGAGQSRDLFPGWAALLGSLILLGAGWWREGR